jgi:uncharacterized membrane protein
LPERLEWVPGETARIQVRAPFPSATALVTVERNGIVSSFVTGLRGKTSIVKVPISTADIPTALVSALAINRGASPSAQETIKLLGSLDYREGTACIVVAPRGKNSEVNEQKVGAKPEKCSGTWVQTATMLNKVVSNPRYNRLIE